MTYPRARKRQPSSAKPRKPHALRLRPKFHKAPNKFVRLDPQRIGPLLVAISGDKTSSVLELGYDSVDLYAHCTGQFALGQSALFSQLAQPDSSLFASPSR